MKVTGPGGPTPPTAAEGVEETKQTEASGAATATSTDPIALLAKQIETGAVTPQQAVDQVVQMVMGEQEVPPAVRAEVRAALEAMVEEDPYLAELVAGMKR